MANVTDNLVEVEEFIKGVINKQYIDRALDTCRWLLSFNNHERFKVKSYITGGKRPDVRFCIDSGSDCKGRKIMTNFIVIEPDYALMGFYSNNPKAYTYFKTNEKRWRINSTDVLGLSIATLREHILESYCIKVKEMGLDSVMCKRKDSISMAKDVLPNEQSSGLYLPNREDFESAYRSLAKPGDEVSVDAILDKIASDAIKAGLTLKDRWRLITERNINDFWSKK